MIKDATTFFAIYYYDAYYKEGQNKFNILIIGSKHIAGYVINQFVSKTDEKEEKIAFAVLDISYIDGSNF